MGTEGHNRLSLVASGGENIDKGCRDFVCKIAESPIFSEEDGASLKCRFPFNQTA